MKVPYRLTSLLLAAALALVPCAARAEPQTDLVLYVEQYMQQDIADSQAVIPVNTVYSVRAEEAQNLAKTYAARGIRLRMQTLSQNGNSVEGALYLDPATLTRDLHTGVTTTSPEARAAPKYFRSHYAGSFFGVELAQAGPLGQRMEVAVKLNLGDIRPASLTLLAFDPYTDTYTVQSTPNAWLDVNGYLHFTTAQGGVLLLTDGALQRKVAGSGSPGRALQEIGESDILIFSSGLDKAK